jgi:hypothetical protein
MDYRNLNKNPDLVKSVLAELPDGRLVCKQDLDILIPMRFAGRNLAYIGTEISICACAAIVVGDSYGVLMACSLVTITPASFSTTTVDNTEYFVFHFAAGSTVIKNVNPVKVDTLTYHMYNEIIAKGNIPWYLDYVMLGTLFDTAWSHAGARVAENPEVMELLVSLMARDPKDMTKYYRTTVASLSDLTKNKPAFIPLKNEQFAPSNTLSRLGGNYFDNALVAALNHPSERVESLEGSVLQ